MLERTRPLAGDHFSVAIYQAFVGGRSHEVQFRQYDWIDGRYVSTKANSKRETRLEAVALDDGSLLVQRSDSVAGLVSYWIARPVLNGAYVVFPVDEKALPTGERKGACAGGTPDGFCRVETYEALLRVAKASATAPMKARALAVMQGDLTQ